MSEGFVCSFCGTTTHRRDDTDPLGKMAEHIEKCEKHPMRLAVDENIKLRAENEALKREFNNDTTVEERDNLEEKINAIAGELELTEEESTWSNMNDVGNNCIESILVMKSRLAKLEKVRSIANKKYGAADVVKDALDDDSWTDSTKQNCREFLEALADAREEGK